MRPLRSTVPLLAVPLVLAVVPLASPAAAAPSTAPSTAPSAALTAAPSAAPDRAAVTVQKARGKVIRGSYLVTLRNGADARRIAKALGVKTRYVYANSVDGFAATLTPTQLEVVRRSPDVVRVEEDQVVQAKETQRVVAGGGLYGLDRSDQRGLPLSGTYAYGTLASTVSAYVIDTGIATAHPDFQGRATNVYDAFGGNGQDCDGHGTHVAGTIGARTYGMAKAVKLRGLRVLDCQGSGSISGIVAAIDWLRVRAQKPAVANLSLGGGYSQTLNNAVTNLSGSGVFVAVAAGNENASACSGSPASTAAAITVAASDKADGRASFSNYGSCVDTYAPGVAIASTWLDGTTNTISGTSMASPHVAGAAALYKARYGDKPSSAVASWITSAATPNAIRFNPAGTPNRLLYKGGV